MPVAGLPGLLLLLWSLAASPLLAATFRVGSGWDVNDIEPGNGLCVAYVTISPPFSIPHCTLRAAIEEANALPGEDIILLDPGVYLLDLAGAGEDRAAFGDLDITDSVQIIGSGTDATVIDGAGLDRIFDVIGSSTTLRLTGLTIRNGRIPGGFFPAPDGGAVRNRGTLVLHRVRIKNSAADGRGGGIYSQGSCVLDQSTVSGNRAGQGGGIHNDGSGRLTVRASTLADNTALAGGGIFTAGGADLVNTTLSGNCATAGAGGGLHVAAGQAQLVHCTVSANVAPAGGGIAGPGRTGLVNTLLAANGGGNCASDTFVDSGGGNLDSGDSCGLRSPSDLRRTDPRLGPLADNGGPTRTHAPGPGSPAIDNGLALAGISTDQRGEPRPTRQAPDTGAVEAPECGVAPCIAPLLL